MSRINCDKCDRRKQCNDEGRLITYFTSDDMWMDPAYDKNGVMAAHGMLRIGAVCPLKSGEVNVKEEPD